MLFIYIEKRHGKGETMKNAVKDKIRGLTDEEARLSRERHGANTLAEVKHKSFLRAFLENLGDPVIRILLGALIVNLFFHRVDGFMG